MKNIQSVSQPEFVRDERGCHGQFRNLIWPAHSKERSMVGETGRVGPRRVARYEWEPSNFGLQTFLKLPLCLSPEDLRAGATGIAIGGTARAGTHLGPQAIRRCDNAWSPPFNRPSQTVRVDAFQHFAMADCGDAQAVPGNTEMTFASTRRFAIDMLDADGSQGPADRAERSAPTGIDA
jgi:hypothetical protein